MDKKKIISIISKEEGTKLDFKLKLSLNCESGKKELAKDICAIANSNGGRGYIVVGVQDKTKKIVGIKKADLFSEEQVQQIISSRCEPPIPISVDRYNIEEKEICIITIYDGDQKPYQIRETGSFYIRRGSTTDTMRKQELVAAFEESLDFSIETCPMIKSNIEFLNMDIVSKYFENKGIYINKDNKKFLLESAGITYIDKESGEEKCTIGGLLVFSDNNSICIPQNMIRIIDKINKDTLSVNVIQGNLLDMIDKSEKLLEEILPSKYPVEAVVEGIKNAVLYREYSSINKIIEVVISYNSILIISPGQMIEENIRGQKINYNKRNMWIYEKLMTLDNNKRLLNNGKGFTRMRNAFKGKGKVKFINSKADDSFKVILPGIKFY
ncbi:AlbA family DNA-binding domain-containing protein [Clostridium chauvoei]|uniref:DNA binding domain-containing protein n=2 Tax=Clostridium chauvoei TaxID=46867 RepID=A0ABD4RF31_9CLOT|nr:RNA-binding domain-containing protein [Clostridium chauvoei]ATD54403.1 ATP-binding protein [Clostridium chauvoei]ATD57914.1 ATP-binding protein [Clostridium chauvoei]MBX7279705.1 putative DNA binding domain-containing protein [Clostridium chauvoei]MBX7282074.1 putative DNA binding domain-containing protein [Clostridium chauvoei]MBX7284596.1 putative DNA binding domain-containing protein [Clostridium chauvoei]